MPRNPTLALLCSLIGCTGSSKDPEGDPVDADGDGIFSNEDCDDADPAVGGPVSYWADDDGDGFGAPTGEQVGCPPDAHAADNGEDCDDADPSAFPGAADTWYDGVDSDCAGDDDFDQDLDGYTVDVDCDDTDPDTRPGAVDTWYDGVDTDCSGGSDHDADGDGDDISAAGGGDCDDADPTISSLAAEVWYDGIDQDCSGGSDFDADGDGYESEVEAPGGGDCDDTEELANPGLSEICNDGIDNDCDGTNTGCGIHGDLTVSDAAVAVDGSQSRVFLGYELASQGDVTGDGATDLVIGSPNAEYAGYASGVVAILDAAPSTRATDMAAAWHVVGDDPRDQFGWSIGFGDFDGDGVRDLVVGAPGDAAGGTNAGAAFLFLGPLSGTTAGAQATTEADKHLYNLGAGGAGISVSSAGDQDGDGRDEALVGVPFKDGSLGMVALAPITLSGRLSRLDDAVLLTSSVSQGFGQSVAGGSDIDGDGVADLLLGASQHSGPTGVAGAAYVVSGPVTASADIDDVGVTLEAPADDEWSGGTGHLAGDLDGDGTPDLLLLAAQGNGGAYAVFGAPTSDRTLTTATDLRLSAGGDDFACGETLDGQNDLDGDGNIDIVFSCPWAPDLAGAAQAGAAYVFYGPFTAGTLDASAAGARLEGSGAATNFSRGLATVDDLDGDGGAELAVGAPLESPLGNSWAGSVYLFRGGDW